MPNYTRHFYIDCWTGRGIANTSDVSGFKSFLQFCYLKVDIKKNYYTSIHMEYLQVSTMQGTWLSYLLILQHWFASSTILMVYSIITINPYPNNRIY